MMEKDQIAYLNQSILELTQRLDNIEKRLNIGTVSKQELPKFIPPKTSYTSTQEADKSSQKQVAQVVNTPSYMLPKEPQQSVNTGRWLGGIAVLFFILAASLFVKLAIDSGWLTPLRQLAATVVFAASLIYGGFRLRERDARYAGLLPAAGLAILFLVSYAGHLYYRIYDTDIAIIIVAVVALFSVYLFTHFKHDFFLIAALLGSYLVPFMFDVNSDSLLNKSSYYLFWNILYCYFAVILQKRMLIVLAAYLGLGVFQIINVTTATTDQFAIAVFIQALQFILFCAATAYYSIKNQTSLTAAEAWAFFPVLMLFYAIEYVLLKNINPQNAPYLALGFSVILIAIYKASKKLLAEQTLASAPMLSAFVAINIFHVVYLELLPAGMGTWFAVFLMLILFLSTKINFSYARFWVTYFIIFAVIGFEYLSLLDVSVGSTSSSERAIFNGIFFASLFFAYLATKKATSNGLILLASYAQALVGLSQIAELIIGYPNYKYLASTLWAVLALISLIYSSRVKDQIMAKFSVYIFGLVAVKVLFFDVSSYDGISRIIALLLVGAMLYAGGLVLRKISTWNNSAA